MITELTPEQESRFEFYRNKWINIGLNTDPCDFETSKKYAKMCYESVGLVCPDKFLVADSPVHAIEIIKELYPEANANEALGTMMFGNQDGYWLSYYDYMLNELGIKECEKLVGLIKLAESCGWWSAFEDAVVLQHRPIEIHMNNNVLHNESGPSVKYRDNYCVWSINGHTVTEQIVMKPETLTVSQIDQETNADIQSIMIDRLGWTNFLRMINAKCLDFRDNEVEGTKEALYQTPKHGNRLVVNCPTGRIFCKGVPDNVNTCEASQKWLGVDVAQKWLKNKVVNVLART